MAGSGGHGGLAGTTVFPLPGTFPWAQSQRGKPRRGMMRRAVFSDLQRKGLEKRFQVQKYISKPDRKKLAEKLGLKDSQVILFNLLLLTNCMQVSYNSNWRDPLFLCASILMVLGIFCPSRYSGSLLRYSLFLRIILPINYLFNEQ